MIIHDLQIQEVYAKRIYSGQKTAEMRKNDRDFQCGDIICFRLSGGQGNDWFVESKKNYYRITHILNGEKWGVRNGYSMLSIKMINPPLDTDNQDES